MWLKLCAPQLRKARCVWYQREIPQTNRWESACTSVMLSLSSLIFDSVCSTYRGLSSKCVRCRWTDQAIIQMMSKPWRPLMSLLGVGIFTLKLVVDDCLATGDVGYNKPRTRRCSYPCRWYITLRRVIPLLLSLKHINRRPWYFWGLFDSVINKYTSDLPLKPLKSSSWDIWSSFELASQAAWTFVFRLVDCGLPSWMFIQIVWKAG